jgi:predicted HTH transcriptional regulator
MKETLANILRDHCEPPLEVAIQEATVQEKPIFVVTVSQGKDKPYQVKNKGFYMRTGATNRLITRYELDEMYGSKPGDLSFGSSFG